MVDYQLLEVLGRGAMGIVHRARNARTREDVALKLLRPELNAAPSTIKRFMREIEALQRLDHPNIIRIREFGQMGDRWCYAMELLEAAPLNLILRTHGPPSPARTFGIFRQAAQALDHCHAQKLLHRDVKPSNLMVDTKDHLTLMDFGLARVRGEEALTTAGKLVGSPRFLAPEVVTGEQSAPPADVYALGVSLYEALTGTPLFPPRAGLTEILMYIMEGEALEVKLPDGPACAAQSLLSRMIHFTANERPTAAQVWRSLDDLIHGQETTPSVPNKANTGQSSP